MIDPHMSLPDGVTVAELGMDVTHFHAMWRVALQGSRFRTDEQHGDQLSDMIKKFRKVNTGNQN